MQHYLRFTAIVSVLVGLVAAAAAAEKPGYSTSRFGLELDGPQSGHLDPVEPTSPKLTPKAKPGVSVPRSKPVVTPKRLSPTRDAVKKIPRPAGSKPAHTTKGQGAGT